MQVIRIRVLKPVRAERPGLSETQAGEQIVDLSLVLDYVGTAFRIDLRTVQQGVRRARCRRQRRRLRRKLFTPLGRNVLEQHAEQLLLDQMDDVRDLLDHLTGQILEILREHDFE